MKANRKTASGQRGFTLLEALLGILIFSIGIIAVIGMQAMAVKNVAEAKYRMDASFLASDLVGQMWTNRANLATYAYAGGAPSAALAPWLKKVTGDALNAPMLPGSATNLPAISVVGTTVTITLFWQHPQEANQVPPPPPHQFSVVASIDCC